MGWPFLGLGLVRAWQLVLILAALFAWWGNNNKVLLPYFQPHVYCIVYKSTVGWSDFWEKKMGTKICLSMRQGEMSSLCLLEAKNYEKVKQIFYLWPGQNQFAHFGFLNKNVSHLFNFKFSFWRMFLEVIERHLQIFWKNVNFKVLVVFWKLKLCCPRIRVEWFNTFWNFQKAIHSWRSGIFYESNSKKIGEFGRPQSLHFQTITGTFKKNFFETLQIPS